MGSSLSPLSSPKPKQASVLKRENLGKSITNKTLTQGVSTDTEDIRSSSLTEPRPNENPSKRKLLCNCIYVVIKLRTVYFDSIFSIVTVKST